MKTTHTWIFLSQSTPSSADRPEAPRAPASSVDDRSTAFRPVEGGNDMQSGEKLLVEAYAAIWVLLFAMLFLWWRRQKQVDRRISDLEQAIAKARAEGGLGPPHGSARADIAEQRETLPSTGKADA